MLGVKLATLYGFYPHKLGFCGPQKMASKEVLLNYLSGKKIPERKIRDVLRNFRGAFSYYKLIAEKNRIKDPFDEKVVKAYWLGNELLENIPIDALRKMIIKEFSKPGLLSKKLAVRKAEKIPSGSKSHHSFHVLVIGSVSGRVELKGKLLDFCRVGWGKVIRLKEEKKDKNGVIVEYQPLCKEKLRYFLGEPVRRFVFWDKIFVPKLQTGDEVSIHWNHIIQILNQNDLSQLKKYTQITIDSVNSRIL